MKYPTSGRLKISERGKSLAVKLSKGRDFIPLKRAEYRGSVLFLLCLLPICFLVFILASSPQNAAKTLPVAWKAYEDSGHWYRVEGELGDILFFLQGLGELPVKPVSHRIVDKRSLID